MAVNPLDAILFGGQRAAPLAAEDEIDAALFKKPSSFLRRAVGDTALSAAQGVVGLGESAVGIAGIPTLGYAGKALRDYAGYDPQAATQFLESQKTPEQQLANRAVAEAKGLGGTLGALAQNPSVIPQKVAETIPLIAGGGALARALPAAVSPLVRGAFGEGALQAGSSAEQSRQASPTGTITPEQAALALTSGAITGAITRGSGALANKLGIGDIEQLVAGGQITHAQGKGLARRAAEGAFTEGVLEEAPQSAQEQALQNIALGRPVAEGVPEATAIGGALGSVIGAGAGALPQGAPPAAVPPGVVPPVVPPPGPVSPDWGTTTGVFQQPLAPGAAPPLTPDYQTALGAVGPRESGEPLSRGPVGRALAAAPSWQTAPGAALTTTPREDISGAYRDQEIAALLREQESRSRDFGPALAQQRAQQGEVAQARGRAEGVGEPQPETAMQLALKEAQRVKYEKQAKAVEAKKATIQGQQAEAQARIPADALAGGRQTDTVGGAIAGRPGVLADVGVRAEDQAGEVVAGAGQSQAVDARAHEAAPSPLNEKQEPTDGQIDAGNFAKGHVRLHGLDISVENPKGSIRRSKPGQPPWEVEMQSHYGYIRGTVGKDNEHIDAYIGPHPESERAFVVDQVDPKTRSFDEHKTILGARSLEDATEIYDGGFSDGSGPARRKAVSEVSVEDFKAWLKEGNTKSEFAPTQGKAPGEIAPPAPSQEAALPQKERRADIPRRKAIAEMSPEEMRRELLVDSLSGLGNKRAYDEAPKMPVQVSIDLDSLKYINDTFGHASGDEMLRAFGEALADETTHAYRVGGDEFVIQGASEGVARAVIARVGARMAGARVEVTLPDGSVISKTGIGFSYGIGGSYEDADVALRGHKAEREVSGERPGRGQEPSGVERKRPGELVKEPAEGKQGEPGGVAAEKRRGAIGGKAAPQKEVDGEEYPSVKPQVKHFDERLSDAGTQTRLGAMAANSGWQQRGGELLRDTEGKVTGRTTWIPREPWFAELPERLNEAATVEAVKKAIAGEKLGAKERRVVVFMLDAMERGRQEGAVEPDIEGMAERAAIVSEAESAVTGLSNDDTARLLSYDTLNDEQVEQFFGDPQESARGAEEADAQGTEAGDRAGGAQARPAGEPILEAYTETELRQREEARVSTERREAEETAARLTKRDADKALGEFVLTGSDREADELTARGQASLFDQPAAAKPAEPEKVKPGAYQVVEEDGYVKIKRGNATIAAGVLGADGRVKDIEFTEERYRKNNMIRMPAMAALNRWEGKRLTKAPEQPAPEKFKIGMRVTVEPKTWFDGTPVKNWPTQGSGVIKKFEKIANIDYARVKYDSGRTELELLDRLEVVSAETKLVQPETELAETETKPAAKTKQKKPTWDDPLRAYFVPGAIVKSYGGYDRVLAFEVTDPERHNWRVQVEAVKKTADGQWQTTERPRWHGTFPDGKTLKAGPVVPAEARTETKTAEPETPAQRTAAEWVTEMARLRDIKPRPIAKLYGANGPTEAQRLAHVAALKKWESDFRKASKAQKEALERDNAAFRAKAAATERPIAKAPPPKEELKDVGEKIEGARKDLWAGRALGHQDIAGMNERELQKFVTKEHVFPRPNYQAIADHVNAEFGDRFDAAKQKFSEDVRELDMGAGSALLIKKIRDSIENPPLGASRESLDDYLTAVAMVRKAIEDLQNFIVPTGSNLVKLAFGEDIVSGERYHRWNHESANWKYLNAMGNKFARIAQVDARDWAKAILEADKTGFPKKQEVWQREYRVFSKEDIKIKKGARYVERKPVDAFFLGAHEGRFLADFTTEAEAEAAKAAYTLYLVLAKKSGNLVMQVDTEAEGINFARDIYKAQHPTTRREDKTPELRHIVREGRDYRGGRDIGDNEFKDAFAFRGVQFGNWTDQRDRQQSLNHAYDALMDLADALGIPPKALSLNGELGMAFGARGTGRAAAHYEPTRVVINLTKTAGAGSAAHEWAHALDDYFGRLSADLKGKKSPYVSHGVSAKSAMRPEMVQAFKDVMSTINNRLQTDEEVLKAVQADIEKSNRYVGSWLKGMREELKDAERDGSGFDALASAVQNAAGDARDERRALLDYFAKANGRLPSVERRRGLDNNLDWRRRYYERLNKALAGTAAPLKLTSEYSRLSTMKGPYWARAHELFARAFESFMLDKLAGQGQRSDYLIHPAKQNREATDPDYPYPAGPERTNINAAFEKLVAAMAHKVTEKGTALYSRSTESQGQPFGQAEGLFGEQPLKVTAIERQPLRSAIAVYHAVRKYAGKTLRETRSGLDINISGSALRHSVFNGFTPESGLAHLELPALLRQAVLAETVEPSKPGDEHSLRAIHRLYAPALINGALYRVKFTVKEFIDPNRGIGHYDLELAEIENPERVTGDGGVQDATTQPPVRSGLTLSIADLLRGAVRDSDGKPFAPDAAKYSYAGERGAKTPKHALGAAREFAEQGIPMDEIRKTTGWFRPKDGKWRFEISDKDAKLKPGWDGYGLTVGETLSHQTLFENYPSLAKIDVVFRIDFPADVNGGYSPADNAIHLNANITPAGARSTLLHELQHAVQAIEGFARGGSPKDTAFISAAAAMGIDVNDRGAMRSAYRRLMGEVEARDVQARAGLTAEELRERPPYVSQGIPESEFIVRHKGEFAADITQGQNAAELRKNLVKRLGARAIAGLERAGFSIIERDSDLPAHLQHPEGGVRGVFDQKTGKSYLVAGNIPAGTELGLVLHEIGVHAGLEGLLGKKLHAHVLEQINEARGQIKVAARLGRPITNASPLVRAVQEAEKRVPNDTRADNVTEETLAYLIEDAANRDLPLVRRILGAIRAWLLRHGFQLKEIRPEDLVALARASVFAVSREVTVQVGAPLVGARYAATGPTFYSEMAQFIDAKAPGKAPAVQWKNLLDAWAKAGKFKGDELEWQGVKEWLDLQEGPVTKDQVLGFILENGISVEETVLAGQSVMQETGQELGTKFAQWQLPGGENYREMLLRLPSTKRQLTGAERAEMTGLGLKGKLNPKDKARYDELNRIELAPRTDFLSTHFDQPNILAHVRFNERTDADGKRVLFIEEIQSDWSSKGRKEGFAQPGDREEFVRLNKQMVAITDRLGIVESIKDPEWKRLAARLEEVSAKNVEGPPAAPFVGKTEAWVALALKRMIRWASEPQGFSRIAWTTGDQQAERYDLSKHLDSVSVRKAPSDRGYVIAGKKGNIDVFGSGVVQRDKLADHIGKELADRAITELDAMEKNPVKTEFNNEYQGVLYQGLDLKVGGSGMRAFYDQIVPNVANGLLKKLGGGRVGTVSIDRTGKGDLIPVSGEQPGFDLTPALRESAMRGLPLFSRQSTIQAIRGFLGKALARKSGNDLWLDYDRVSSDEAGKIKAQTGLNVVGYAHTLDESAARHMLKEHGDPAREATLEQLPLTKEDLTRLPEIVHGFDSVSRGHKVRGLETIVFSKIFPDGTHYFVEEIRTGRRKLAAKTMWKERATAPRATPEGGVAQTSETFRSRAEPGGDKGVNPNDTYAPSPSGIQAEEGAGPKPTIEPGGAPVKGPQAPLYSRAAATLPGILDNGNVPRVREWFAPKLDAALVKLQDRFLMLKRHQEAVAARSGPIPENADAYLAQTLYHGRADARLKDLKAAHIDPLIEAIHRSGANIDQVEDFLYALHAPSRNKVLAGRNPRFDPRSEKYGGSPGSGMTDEESRAILQSARDAGLYDKLNAVSRQVSAINESVLRARVADGLMNEEEADQWRNQWENYVPLRGVDGKDSFPRLGHGFTIKGAESKQAFGRASKAGDLLAHVVSAAEEAIVRGEKNKVGQAFLTFAEENPSDHWEVKNIQFKPKLDPKTGEMTFERDPFYTLADDVFSVKREGKQFHVKLGDPALARSLKNLGADDMNGVVRTVGALTRALSFLSTTANPEFLISNFLRDIQEAGINLAGEKGTKMAGQVMKDVPRALRGAYQAIRKGDTTSEWAKYYHELERSGGLVGYFDSLTVERQAHKLEAMLKDLDPSKPRQAWIAFRSLGKFIQDSNQVVESGVRLSAYVNARRAGASEAQAAGLAKNLTVNFNRRGELGPVMNSLYMFFNAGVQGTARLFQALKHKRTRQIAGGIVGLGVLLEILNQSMSGSGDDDKKYYDKIDDWIKDHNLIVMMPNGKDRFMLPLPYGYNVFHALGRNLGSLFFNKSPGQAAGNILHAGLDAFNPLGGATSLAQFMSPTLTDPIIQQAENLSHFGTPIKPGQSPFGPPRPESSLYWRAVNPAAKEVAAWLNDATGGSPVRPGAVDISPEIIEHWAEFVGGGAGRTLMKTLNTGTRLATGEVLPLKEVPFLRRLIGEPDERADAGVYREAVNEVVRARNEIRYFQQAGDAARVRDVRRDYGAELRLYGLAQATDNRISALRRRARLMESRGLKTDAIEDQIDSLKMGFTKRYHQATAPL